MNPLSTPVIYEIFDGLGLYDTKIHRSDPSLTNTNVPICRDGVFGFLLVFQSYLILQYQQVPYLLPLITLTEDERVAYHKFQQDNVHILVKASPNKALFKSFGIKIMALPALSTDLYTIEHLRGSRYRKNKPK